MERISADAGIQFTSTDFKEECQTCGVHLMLSAPEHQEMNVQVEVTQSKLRTIAHSLMVHARVLEAYIHFELMNTSDHIIPLLPIKYLINKDGKPSIPFKLATSTKPSVSHLRVLFFPFVVPKATANADKRALNLCHLVKNGFCGIFVGI